MYNRVDNTIKKLSSITKHDTYKGYRDSRQSSGKKAKQKSGIRKCLNHGSGLIFGMARLRGYDIPDAGVRNELNVEFELESGE